MTNTSKEFDKWLACLGNDRLAETGEHDNVIDDILKAYRLYSRANNNSKESFSSFMKARENLDEKIGLSTRMIAYAINSLTRSDGQDPARSKRVLLICSFLGDNLWESESFAARLAREGNLLDLISILAQSPSFKLRVEATKITRPLFERRNTSILAAIDAYDRSHSNKSLTKLLIEILVDGHKNGEDVSDPCLYSSLRSLFSVFPESCAKLEASDFEELLKLALMDAVDSNEKQNKVRLYQILIAIVCNGVSDSRNSIFWNNQAKILADFHQLVIYLLSDPSEREGLVNKLRNLLSSYKDVFRFILAQTPQSSPLGPIDGLDGMNTVKTPPRSKAPVETKDCLIELRSQKQEFLKEKDYLNRKLAITEEKSAAIEQKWKDSEKRVEMLTIKKRQLEADLDSYSKIYSAEKTPNNNTKSARLENSTKTCELVESRSDDENFLTTAIEKGKCETKDEAKRFIQIIANKHDVETTYRGLICGTLRNLSANLYTSPTHFLSEIIQNFEDNTYDQATKPWHLKVIINRDYLLFCNNEIGFSPKDVRSICSVSESTKTMGKHCGYKGIGFKSVYLCTDNPIVYSRPSWFFEFNRQEGEDEMAYITPRFIDYDDEFEPQSKFAILKSEIERNQDSNTFLFLPLRKKYSDDEESKKYFESIEASIDENVLLFTKNLEKIVIDNKISGQVAEFSCQKQSPESVDICDEVSACDSIIHVNRKQRSEVETISKELKYRVCQSTIHVPRLTAQEAGLTDSEAGQTMKITVAFPDISMVKCRSFPVYSLLPVQDLGFKFIINCYWSVATSRETINEHSSLNQLLLSEVVKLYEKAASNDPQIKNNIQYFLPVHTSTMSPWWNNFVFDMRDKLKPILEDVFKAGGSTSLKLRVINEAMSRLIDKEGEKVLGASGFQILDSSSIILTEKELELYGVTSISINDLIECMTNQNEMISRWIDARPKKWWEHFFNLANQMRTRLEIKEKNLVRSARIFFKDGRRVALDTDQLEPVFFTPEQSMESWSKCIVSFESYPEKEFLINTVGLQELTSAKLIELILRRHIEASFKSSREIWQDLSYIKDHFGEYTKFIESERSAAWTDSLCLPVLNNDNSQDKTRSHVPINYAILSSLFGYDLTKLKQEESVFNSERKLIDFQSLKALFNLNLYDTLKWELFLIKLGCSLPMIEEQDLIARSEKSDPALPVFTPLESFDSRSVKLACKLHEIVGSARPELVHSLKYLPVKAVHQANPTKETYPLSSVGVESIFREHLPTIQVPEHTIRLAENLGVLVRPTIQSCLEILKKLVDTQCKNAETFIEWLLHLRTFVSGKKDFCQYSNQKLIYLQNLTGKGEFYSPRDIYFCSESSGIRLICKNLGKTLINDKTNTNFKLIEGMLTTMGSQTAPSTRDIIECLCKMTNDATLFASKNLLSFLTNTACEDFLEMFLHLEENLKKIFPLDNKYANLDPLKLELKEREEIVREVQSQMERFFGAADTKLEELDFPVVTFDRKLEKLSNSRGQRIVACFQADLLKDQNDLFVYDKLFFDAKIASRCPRVMGLLNADYMDEMVSVEIVQKGPIYENPSLTEIFRQTLGKKEIQVLQVNSLNFKIVSKSQQKSKWLNSVNYAIIQKKYIIFKEPKNEIITKAHAYEELFKLLLEFAIESFDRSKTSQQIKEKAAQYAERIQSLSQTSVSGFSRERRPLDAKRKISDLICDTNNTHAVKSRNIYFSTDSSQRQLGFVRPEIKAEYKDFQAVFDRRAPEMDPSSVFKRPRPKPGLEKEDESKRPLTPLSIKAELYFSCLMKSKYPKSYVEEESWVSSARQECYEEAENIDDSLGWAFKIKDTKNIFTKSQKETCLINVKPTPQDWDGTLRLSKNELDQINNIDKVKCAFVVVIIANVESPDQIQIAKIVDLTEENLNTSSSKIEGKKVKLVPDSYDVTLANDEGFFEDDGQLSRVGQDLTHSQEINESKSEARVRSDEKFVKLPDESSSELNMNLLVSESIRSQSSSVIQQETVQGFDTKNRQSILVGVVEGETEKLFYERVFDQLNNFGKSLNIDFQQKYKLSDLAVFCTINSKELNPSIEIAKVEKAAYDDLIANFKNYLRYESKSNSFKIMLLEKLIREYEIKRAEFDASSVMTVYNIQRNEISHLLNGFKYSPVSAPLIDNESQNFKIIGVMNGYNFVKETQKLRCAYTSRYSIENYVFDPLNLFHVITEFEAYWRQITAKLEKQICEKTKNIYQNLKKMPNAFDSQTLSLYLKSITNILRKDTEDCTIQTIKFIYPVEVSLDFEKWLLEIDNLELYRRLHNLTCTRPNSCILGLENGNSVSSCFFSQMHEKYCPSKICLLNSKTPKSKSNHEEDACFLNLYKGDFIQKKDYPLLLQEIVKRGAQDLLNYYKKNSCIMFIPEDLLLEFKEAAERRLPQIPSRFHDLVRKNRRSKFDEFKKILENDENNPFMPSKFLDQTPLHLLVWLGRNDIILEMYNQYATDSGQLAKWRTDPNLKSTMRCLKDDFGASFCKELKQYLKLRTDQDDLSEIDEATDDEIKTEDSAKEHDTTFALRFFEKQLEKVVAELKIDIYFSDVNFDDLFKDSINEEILFITDD